MDVEIPNDNKKSFNINSEPTEVIEFVNNKISSIENLRQNLFKFISSNKVGIFINEVDDNQHYVTNKEKFGIEYENKVVYNTSVLIDKKIDNEFTSLLDVAFDTHRHYTFSDTKPDDELKKFNVLMGAINDQVSSNKISNNVYKTFLKSKIDYLEEKFKQNEFIKDDFEKYVKDEIEFFKPETKKNVKKMKYIFQILNTLIEGSK